MCPSLYLTPSTQPAPLSDPLTSGEFIPLNEPFKCFYMFYRGGIQVKHASYHINHMWLITRMHKDLPHYKLFYTVGYYKWFSKRFSLVQNSYLYYFIKVHFKLVYERFQRISKGFQTYFTKEHQVVIFLSIKVFPRFSSKFSFMPYTLTC